MAPRHEWTNTFVKAGWHKTLSPAGHQLLWTLVGRVDYRTLRTSMTLRRLRDESGLAESAFYEAKSDLDIDGLIRRRKADGKWTVELVFPVPAIPPEGPPHRTFPYGKGLRPRRINSATAEKRLRAGRVTRRRMPRLTPVSAARRRTTRNPTEGTTVVSPALALWQQELVERFPRADAAAVKSRLFGAAAAVRAGAPVLDVTGALLDQLYGLGCRQDGRGRYLTELQLVDPLRAAAGLPDVLAGTP